MRNFLFLLNIIYSTISIAQKQANIWYFGDGIGINFNANPPKALLDGKNFTNEGSASIADSLGQLLFYTDGSTVWNKYHDTLKNGSGLYGRDYNTESMQAALIIKKPGSNKFYYIFSLAPAAGQGNPHYGVSYSILDISGDNGLGEIIIKNKVLLNQSTERLAATKHKNMVDFWILSPTRDGLYLYILSENGLVFHKKTMNNANFDGERGRLKFSNNGRYIGNTSFAGKICVADFDNYTGQISNQRTISEVTSYGLEFSPNSKFIYFSHLGNSSFYQCEIEEIKNKPLNNTKCIKLYSPFSMGSIQMAPNGKIYTAGSAGLNIIHYPNLSGLGCNFEKDILIFPQRDLPDYKRDRILFGLPEFVQSYIYKPSIVANNACINTDVLLKLKNNSSDSIRWIFGDGMTKISVLDTVIYRYSTTGDHYLKAILYSGFFIDTLYKKIHIFNISKPRLGNDTLVCIGELFKIDLNNNQNNKIIWNDKDTVSQKTISVGNTFEVNISNDYCSVSDTIKVEFVDCNIIIDSFCLPYPTRFLLNELGTDSVKWDFGDFNYQTSTFNKIHYTYLKADKYVISATLYKQNLFKQIKKNIQIIGMPINFLPKDTSVCDEFLLSPKFISSQYYYYWNTGSATSEIKINKNGVYSLMIQKEKCHSSDTITVKYTDCNCILFIPNVFSPNMDNLNDWFKPQSNCSIENIDLLIFNRWGEKIFTGNGITTAWDGTYKGERVCSGAYFYQLNVRLKNNNKLSKSGIITLHD